MLSVSLLSGGWSVLDDSEDAAAAVGCPQRDVLSSFKSDTSFSRQQCPETSIPHRILRAILRLWCFAGGPSGRWAPGSRPEEGRPAGDVGSQSVRVGSHAVCNCPGRNHPGKEPAVPGGLAACWERRWRRTSYRRYWRVKRVVSFSTLLPSMLAIAESSTYTRSVQPSASLAWPL